MKSRFTCLLLCGVLITNLTAQSLEKDKRNPFDKFEFVDDHPYIYVDDQLAKLISIADFPVSTYIDMAKAYNPKDWKNDFVRYTHYFMDDLKIERGAEVQATFELDGKVEQKKFPLTLENREFATAHYEESIGQNRIEREHNNIVSDKFKYLNVRLDGYEPQEKDWLTKEEAIHDLEHLEWQIVNNHSYADLTKFDYQNAIDVMIADLKDGISNSDFALQLKILVAHFGDGHGRVSMYKAVLKDKNKRGGLPFTIIGHDRKFYAIDSKKKAFFEPDFPMIQSINGVKIETYYQLAKQMVTKTTPDFVEGNSIEYLRELKLLMGMNGDQATEKVNVTFTDGQFTKNKILPIGRYKSYPLQVNHVLHDTIFEKQIGYIALNDGMKSEDKFLAAIQEKMKKLKDTKGLIIDIRGNGGGSRAPLNNFLPYFIKKPVVCNLARFRIDSDSKPTNGYLEKRFAYPENYSSFTTADKNCIADFKRSFVPKYVIEKDKFSDYHYMVVNPETIESRYYYDKPVIVLIDSGCFSASDIFAAGIQQGDNVRLLGETTGGGSGFSKSRTLPNSKIKVKLSRIVSYQPNGKLYDGVGVKPDIEHSYTLADKMGLSDDMLLKAIELLRPMQVKGAGTTKE